MVSRQFRVLETVGSSPAASTKKTVFDGLFYFVEADEDENPPRAINIVRTLLADDLCSYYLGARIGFAFSAQSASSSLVSGKHVNIHFW